MSAADASVQIVMSVTEACEIAGRTVLYEPAGGEPGEVVITGADGSLVEAGRLGARWFDRKSLDPIEEAHAVEEMVTACGSAAKAAERFGRHESWVSQRRALLRLTPELQDSVRSGELPVRIARSVAALPAGEQEAAWRTARPAVGAPAEAEALLQRSGPGSPALVYVITHAAFGAAKIGVSDPAGARIAQHRRAGWQLMAAFQVGADAAAAIEADVLGWWRGDLGLPPYLNRGQMPQDGWTETVAACRIDLAATVAHICELALLPESRPAASSA
jgi:hypothetical protein